MNDKAIFEHRILPVIQELADCDLENFTGSLTMTIHFQDGIIREIEEIERRTRKRLKKA